MTMCDNGKQLLYEQLFSRYNRHGPGLHNPKTAVINSIVTLQREVNLIKFHEMKTIMR